MEGVTPKSRTLGGAAENGGDIRQTLNIGLLGEVKVSAVGLNDSHRIIKASGAEPNANIIRSRRFGRDLFLANNSVGPRWKKLWRVILIYGHFLIDSHGFVAPKKMPDSVVKVFGYEPWTRRRRHPSSSGESWSQRALWHRCVSGSKNKQGRWGQTWVAGNRVGETHFCQMRTLVAARREVTTRTVRRERDMVVVE
jgi:hypothetical protein